MPYFHLDGDIVVSQRFVFFSTSRFKTFDRCIVADERISQNDDVFFCVPRYRVNTGVDILHRYVYITTRDILTLNVAGYRVDNLKLLKIMFRLHKKIHIW